MKCFIGILLLSFVSLGLTQNVDDKTIKDVLGELPVSGLNTTGLPSMEEAEEIFKKKCIKEANLEAYDKSVNAKENMVKCVQGLINVEQLKTEIENAKPTGDLDIVFKKYCKKSPLLKKCISNFTDDIEPCLNVKERENIKMILNITESLTSFICYKEGDRIALFIAEGGPECLMDKQEAIQECVNSSMSKYIPSEPPSLDNLPELLLKAEQCDDMNTMQECIVRKLEDCSEPTPANIAESLFKFIKQVTPCGKQKPQKRVAAPSANNQSDSSSAPTIYASLLLLSTVVIFFM